MKLNLLLLSSLEASKLYFGRNGCEFGPSYWCENISKAHECGEGAKQFCIENRWNEPSAPDEVCETCKTAVGLVHMYLTDKKYDENHVLPDHLLLAKLNTNLTGSRIGFRIEFCIQDKK